MSNSTKKLVHTIEKVPFRRQLKSIRDFCLECVCGQSQEVKLCTSLKCPLFAYRFGKGPKKEGKKMILNIYKEE